MTTQFITNGKGEKTAAIISISDYKNMLHQHHLNLELTDKYKRMIDNMLEQENTLTAEYASLSSIKDRFQLK